VKRLVLWFFAVFWAAMMGLLWRTEYGAGRHGGSPVPVSGVWEKIVTAPDSSSLQITHRGTNIGYCRWSASVGQDISALLQSFDEAGPDGLIEQPTNYTIDLDGHITLPGFGARASYDLTLRLDPEQNWQDFQLRLKMRPDVYEIRASAVEQALHFSSDSAGQRLNRVIPFSDFRNPQKLLREFGGPLLPGLLASVGLPVSTNALARFTPGLQWKARHDWLPVGRTPMRVYRLQTRLLDRFLVRVFVSPVGEILRVELPGDILLQHETLNNLPSAP
jgi:hypothetical protein